MLEEDKTRLQTTLNTIKTAGDNLNVRSNLTVDGSIRAKNIILDDDKICLNTELYPNIKKETLLALIDQLIDSSNNEGNSKEKSDFDIPIEFEDNMCSKTIEIIKDIDNYFIADILIIDDKVKILRKINEGFKDLKFSYNKKKKVLNYTFKQKSNMNTNELKINIK